MRLLTFSLCLVSLGWTALAYQESDFVISNEHIGEPPPKLDATDEALLLRLYEDAEDDDGSSFTINRAERTHQLDRIPRLLQGLVGLKLGLSPRALAIGSVALLSLIQRVRFTASQDRNRHQANDGKNWKDLYDSLVAKAESERVAIMSNLKQLEERALYWESFANKSESSRESLEEEYQRVQEKLGQSEAKVAEIRNGMDAELEEIRRGQPSGENERRALKIELEQVKDRLQKVQLEKEKAEECLRIERSTESQSNDEALLACLKRDLNDAQERASYWEARSTQQAAQHSIQISQLCEEMKKIMVEEKERLQRDFEKETEHLRKMLISNTPSSERDFLES